MASVLGGVDGAFGKGRSCVVLGTRGFVVSYHRYHYPHLYPHAHYSHYHYYISSVVISLLLLLLVLLLF